MNLAVHVRCAALAAALVVSGASAQLSGAYTIDAATPTGGTNYISFVDAATALTSQGVSGPVTFSVLPGAYSGFALATYAGHGAANPVAFVASPGTVTMAGVAAGLTQTIRLGTAATLNSGPSYVTLEGIDTSGAPSGAGIMVAGCGFVTVRRCNVSNSGAGVALVVTHDSVVEDCIITATAGTPGTLGNATYCGGISAYNNCDNVTFRRNQVVNCTGNGYFVGASGDGTSCANPVIVNNILTGTPGTGSYPGGIAIRRGENAVVSFNSIWMPAGSANHGIAIMQLSSTTIAHMWPKSIGNNVIKHDGTGACIAFNQNGPAGPMPPDFFDYNIYDPSGTAAVGASVNNGGVNVVYTLHPTLAGWLANPIVNIAAFEANTLVAPAGFVSATDLHMTAGSAAVTSGFTLPEAPDDVDGQIRPPTPSRGADEPNVIGIFANFTGTPIAGSAPLTVNFTDTTYTSDPSGVVAWLWDFQNDGTIDSFLQNPSHTYLVPGTYTVAMTATDALNGSNTKTRVSYVVVGPYVFDAFTTGGGVGDLVITPVPHFGAQSSVIGFMFISFTTAQPVGTGPFFGIMPDGFTWPILLSPALPGDILHWVYTPGLFPDVPLVIPPGFLSALAGLSADFVQVDLDAVYNLSNVSNVDRVTF